MANLTVLKVPADKEQQLHDLLVEHDVPTEEIAKAGGPGGFLSKFLGGLSSGQYPLLKKLIEVLVTKGISSLGGAAASAKSTKAGGG